MINIINRKLKNTTLYSVRELNGVPTFTVHKNCKITTEEGCDFKYAVDMIDDKNRLLCSHECDTLSCLDEIKVMWLFYDEKDALKYYKDTLNETEKCYKKKVKDLTEELNKYKKRLKTIQKFSKDI